MYGWFKIKKAAKYSGVSERTLREWLKRGLRHSRLNGRTILIKISWIDEFLESFVVDNKRRERIVDEIVKSIKV